MALETGRAACKVAAQSVWKKLWKSRDHADVSFHANDGSEIKVHKLLLVTRSPVMKALLYPAAPEDKENDENEKPEEVAEDKEEKATLDDVLTAFRRFSRIEVHTFLELLYTGESSGIDGYIIAVYHLAKLLKVEDVLELVQVRLRHRLYPGNAVDALILAGEEKDDELRASVEKYIIVRRWQVMKCNNWTTFKVQHPDVYMGLLEKMACARGMSAPSGGN